MKCNEPHGEDVTRGIKGGATGDLWLVSDQLRPRRRQSCRPTCARQGRRGQEPILDRGPATAATAVRSLAIRLALCQPRCHTVLTMTGLMG